MAVEKAFADDRSVVLTGEAGIGKSTLAAAALADEPDVVAVAGRASLRWEPFAPFRDLLGDKVPDGTDQVVSAVLRRRPDALLVDDLHWADPASIEVVLRVAPLMRVVATVRTDGAGSELLDRMVAAGFVEVALGPLDDATAAALVCDVHPGLDGETRAALVRRAGGNPLLLRELGRTGEPSPTLARVLTARLGQLSPAARASMARLCVLARPCAPAIVGDGAAELVAAGLAREVGLDLEVPHPLLGEVVVASLDREETSRARREVAEHIEPAEAAHLLAESGDREEAHRLATVAATRATGPELAGLLELAVRCAPPPGPDVELRLAASAAHILAGDPAAAARVVDLAPDELQALEPFVRGQVGLAAMHAALDQQRYDLLEAHLAATWPLLAGTDSPEEVRMRGMATVVSTRVRLDGRIVLDDARATAALADRIGQERAYAHKRLGSALLTAGDPGWAEEQRLALDLAEEEGDRLATLTVLEGLVLGLWVTGDVPGARAIAHEQVLGNRPGSHVHHVALAHLCLFDVLVGSDRTGVVARGLPVLDEHPVFRCRPFLEAAVAIARADLGAVPDAGRQLRAAHERAGDHAQWRAVVAWAEAEVAWAGGDHDGLTGALDLVDHLGVGDYPPAVLVRVLEAHRRVAAGEGLDDLPPAVGVLPAWAAFADEWTGLCRAELGDEAGAVAAFVAAAGRWAGCDERSRVRCLWAAGEAARRGGVDVAAGHSEEALRLAEHLSMAGMVSRARRSLRGGGVVRYPRGAARLGLSGREAEAMDLVAEGRTTAQIAEQLHLSAATVATLVRTAMRKLGVPTRRAAAARWQALTAHRRH